MTVMPIVPMGIVLPVDIRPVFVQVKQVVLSVGVLQIAAQDIHAIGLMFALHHSFILSKIFFVKTGGRL